MTAIQLVLFEYANEDFDILALIWLQYRNYVIDVDKSHSKKNSMYALDFTLRLTVYRLMQQVTIKAQISPI